MRLIQKTDDNQLIIKIPDGLIGKELSILIVEKPIIKKIDEPEHRRRLDSFEAIRLKNDPIYEPHANEWYQQ